MKFVKKVLANGLTIVYVPFKKSEIISMGFFVNAGSRNETEQNSGIAHFLEHMMFKGTSHRTANDIFKEFDNMGAAYNAVTTAQYTYYYVYGNIKDTKKILDIMLDIYINPDFDTKEIKKEKKVIVEEMRMRADTPIIKLYGALHAKIFKDTSLERTIIGTEETVSSMNSDDFFKFRDAMYKPNNTVFVIVGNFNPVALNKLIVRVLEPLENSPTAAKTYFDEKPIIMQNMLSQSEPYVYIKKNPRFKQAYVLLAFPMYDLYSTHYKEIEMISNLLSAGFSSRLYKSLREENGITYSSSAYPIAYNDCGVYIISLTMNPIEFKKGIKILMSELKRVKQELITKEEFSKVYNASKNEILYASMRPVELLTYYGINFLTNRTFSPDPKQDIEEYSKVTRQQIQQTANNIFLRDKINLFIYGNVDETNFDFIDL